MTSLALAALLLCPAARADWTAIRASGRLRVATEGAFKPFNYFEGPKLKGFEIDLADEIGRRLGLKVEWLTLPFDSLLIGLNQGRYDLVIASHGITPEREKAVDFAEPHYCTGAMIVSRPGGPKTAKELEGKIVGAAVGTTYYLHLREIKGIQEVKTYPKDADVFQSLLQDRVDAWIGDRFMALEAAKAHPEARLAMGEMLFPEKIGMAVAKGDVGLREALNKALEAMLKDGAYRRLSRAYFSQDVRCR